MPYADPARLRVYQRVYQREWVRKRRQAFFADKKCVWCDSIEDLELDHIDPALKDTNVIWSWTESRRLGEIAKCQVLCHKCHKKKTGLQRETCPPHGTLARYKSRKFPCRCPLCRQANAAWECERRQSKKEASSRGIGD